VTANLSLKRTAILDMTVGTQTFRYSLACVVSDYPALLVLQMDEVMH